MKWKVLSAYALVGACALEGPAWAQSAEPQQPPPAVVPPVEVPKPAASDQTTAAAAPCCKLPALTTVELEILTQASSKNSRQGDQIRIRVIEAIRIDGKVVVPSGTEGYAEVIQASHGAFGGKAGELVIGAPYLMLGTQRIDLKRFRYGPVSGRDNTGQAILVGALAGGVFGLAVGGGNTDVQNGARANAVVTRDTLVSVNP